MSSCIWRARSTRNPNTGGTWLRCGEGQRVCQLNFTSMRHPPHFRSACAALLFIGMLPGSQSIRSEEHTSELQSLRHLVCRLLLEPSAPLLSTLSLHDALPIYVELHLAGALHAQPKHRRHLATLRRRAEGMPVEFHINASPSTLQECLRRATLYWHATGFAVDQIGRAHV